LASVLRDCSPIRIFALSSVPPWPCRTLKQQPLARSVAVKNFLILLLASAAVFLWVYPSIADEPELLILNVSDPISPGVTEFVTDGLQLASDAHSAGIIITLDTPGGLAESMRKIVQAIFACKVPVIVYVTPSGARAASAGVMITLAADIAAMTPGTNIGAAHPVGAGGQEIGKTMAEKAVNDMVAFAKGIANRRGRNAQWVEQAVRESVSVTAKEALKENIIDVVAKNLDDLVAQVEGRTIKEKGTLHLVGVRRISIEEGLRIKILKTISDPNIAYILLMIGLAGLYFELANPGTVLPGVVGGIALILAFFSMQTLPVNTAGIMLILLSIIFFILELKVTSYGMLSFAGIFSMVLGSMMLFKGAGPQFQVAWHVLLPTVLLVAGFFVGVVVLVVRAHTRKARTGADGLVDEVGVVKQVQGREGKILVHGELWRAEFSDPVSVGDKVQIKAVEDLVLIVSRLAG
jgi:membrane-bound serine protease (ClpP class)